MQNIEYRGIGCNCGAGGAVICGNDSITYYYYSAWCSVESKVLKGIDSLLSIVQMPAGVPLPLLQ